MTPLAPAAPASQPPPGRSAQEASAAPFAAVLDNHQARTAPAEGHSPKRPTGAADQTTIAPAARAARCAKPAGADATQDAQPDVAQDGTPAAPALPGPVVDPAPAALAVAVTVTAPRAVPPPLASPSTAPAPAAPAGAPQAAGPAALPGAPLGPAAPATADHVAGAPLPGAPLPGASLAAPPSGTPTPAGPATPASPAVPTQGDGTAAAPNAGPASASTQAPAATTQAPGAATDASAKDKADAEAAAAGTTPAQADADARAKQPGADAQPAGDAPRTMAVAVADALRAAAPVPAAATAPAANAATAATGAPAPAAPATTAPATPSAPAAPSGAVTLPQAVETVRLMVSAASQRGVTRARIALRPEELGGVEVHLRHTAEGLSARLVADAPQAAQVLAQAAGDLRRSFEEQGLNLVRIDIATADDDRAGTGAGAAQHRDGERRRHSGAAGGDIAGAQADTPIVERTIELANGALVDVLA